MANATYKKIIEMLVSASVPEEKAAASLDRALTLKGLEADSIMPKDVSIIRKNIEGAVVVNGNKDKLTDVKTALDAMA